MHYLGHGLEIVVQGFVWLTNNPWLFVVDETSNIRGDINRGCFRLQDGLQLT